MSKTVVNNARVELQNAVKETLSTGISQNKLARQMDVSAATLINVKTGNWTDVSDAMVRKLRAYFRLDAWGIRKTHNFVVITKLCDDAKRNNRMLAVAGYTGAGKTTALRHFSQRNTETYYVLATVLFSKKTFLQEIQRAMGISEGTGVNEMMQAIVHKLNAGSASLLIIDDAPKLSHVCLRLLQVIYDSTEYSAGIVLAGTEYLKDELDRLSRKNVMGFQELRRRIAYWQPLRRPSKVIVQAVCEDYGISDKGAVKYIYEKASDYGTLRNLVTNAMQLYSEQGGLVTREVLVDLHIGDYGYEASRA